LEARAKTIGERGDIGYVVVLADFGLFLDIALKLSLPVCV
jgi:hypothetical protein